MKSHGEQPSLFEAATDASMAEGEARSLARRFAELPAGWREALADFMRSTSFPRLCSFVDTERASGKTIYPDDEFHALRLCAPERVKVVILGQDPYHGEDRGIPQAHGLAFSVPPGVRVPPSLRNIRKEIALEYGREPAVAGGGCLDAWARQGVLLLNTSLTVERHRAGSHAKRGWEACTDALIAYLGQREQAIVFMLWGAHAQAKRLLLQPHGHHLVLEAAHPSPLSAYRGFFGCGHFRQANEFLEANGRTPVDWIAD